MHVQRTLHHLPVASRQDVLSDLKRVLKPGGLFLFVEGYCDGQHGARKTQIILHYLRAVMDMDGGLQHYPTQTYAELIQHVKSMAFTHNDFFDVVPECVDYRDRNNLDNIARFIDQEIDQWSHLPRYPQYRRFGELLKKRMHRTGFLGSKGLVAICH